MNQEIRFCTSVDGVRIAYATAGSGPPLVKAANYLTHLEHDWESPVWRHWLREFCRDHTLIRYDERGCGLSDWDVDAFSIDAWVEDLEAVVDALELDSFPLLGISQGASVSVAYAVKHPERVSHLLLYGGYARGRFQRDLSPEERIEAETMINVMRIGWGKENPAFRQLFSTQLMPEGSRNQIRSLNELARVCTTADTAARMERAFYEIDVTNLAPLVRSSTLVLHGCDDAAIPFDEGRRLAALIPGSRFVPLDTRNHILTADEPAWNRFLSEVRDFLGPTRRRPSGRFATLTPREDEVLDWIARGRSNGQIADRLCISPKTVRNHITHIFRKLEVERRAEAIVAARRAGYGRGEVS